MSVAAINWALIVPGTPTQKHLLLVLANYANDAGIAFPSSGTLMADTGMGKRTIVRAKKELLEAGLIEKMPRYGQSGVRLSLSLSPEQLAPNSATAAPQNAREAPNSAKCDTEEGDARAAHQSATAAPQNAREATPPNHQLTTSRTRSIPPNPPAQKSVPKFELPDWVPVEPWQGWLEMRRSKKCPPTPRALQLAVRDLAELRDAGHDPGAVLDQSTQRGWRGLFAIKGSGNVVPFAPQQAQNSRPSSNPFEGLADGFGDEIPEMTPAEKAAWKRHGGQP